MDPLGKRELLQFYDRHLQRFGDSPQSLRWTAGGQLRRYEALLAVAGDLSEKSVLDFGCGKGDLRDFLRERAPGVRYCGIDINENLIELAREKHPYADFLALDIEETPPDRSFDTVLICGVFNLRIAGIAESLERCLKILFPLCRDALHLNVPSARTPHKGADMFYADPAELLAFARRELSPGSTLREDLVEGEIFLSVRRGAGATPAGGPPSRPEGLEGSVPGKRKNVT